EQDTRLADVDPTDGCRVRQRIWKSEKGPTVVLYEIENGGHTLPQLKSKIPKRLVGRTCQDIHTTETIWAFFADKKRRKAEAEIQAPATGE
ncbi:MAG: hypothetical protein P1V35_14580, partial [Planctomycetota bacterium]|nr:hypothetical protein [Planctomycetota bacterium]